ncbi:sensor histidine kinase [Streptomyces sp. NPDC007325]|uniref:sensor histidine kinase n=1 Tax=Streptomyces sp. NPDC007325 TaxID=3154588 RepID=UPI0033EC4228
MTDPAAEPRAQTSAEPRALPLAVRRALPPAVTRALAWAAALAYLAVPTAVVLHTAEPTGTRLALPVLSAALVVPLLARRPGIALGVLLAGSASAAVAASSRIAAVYPPGTSAGWQLGQAQALLADLAVAYVAATRRPLAAGAAAGATFAVQAVSLAFARTGADAYVSHLVVLGLTTALAWTAGHLLRERRAHARELRSREAAEAVTAERLRIARELHDMVAHSIGVITIQAGVGRRVAGSRPEEARRALAAIESTGKDTLAGLRRMLVALRADDPEAAPRDPAPGLADLDRLVATTAEAGVRVGLERRGTPRGLPPDVELAAYRIVQEGVTNVVRHAHTETCRVVVDVSGDAVGVEITDDGPGRPARGGVRGDGHRGSGAGYGITGMRERAALLGGEFTAGPRPGGGFRVAARLPVPEEARVTPVAEEARLTSVPEEARLTPVPEEARLTPVPEAPVTAVPDRAPGTAVPREAQATDVPEETRTPLPQEARVPAVPQETRTPSPGEAR